MTAATVLAAGNYTLNVTFTPDESSALFGATRSVVLAVGKVALAGAAALSGLSACGGGGGGSITPPPTTHPQSYTLTVTATEGPLSHTTALTLNTY